MRTLLTQVHLVTPEAVLRDASFLLEDDRILSLDGGIADRVESWGGDYVFPGFVDVHTDNLEKHFMPRHGVTWDAVAAAASHDGQVATAGITTVFDSISLHGHKDGLDRGAALPEMLAGLQEAGDLGLLRADHRLHLRCEVSGPGIEAQLTPHLDHPLLQLLSVMDHTPGQGQYRDLEGHAQRLWKAEGGELDAMIARLEALAAAHDLEGAQARRGAVATLAAQCGVPLASHDDDSAKGVAFGKKIGCTIAEFPVCEEAALAAKRLGMASLFGAPNLVRGRSHSGNLGAGRAAELGVLDGVCSDYMPMAMLKSVAVLLNPPFSWPLWEIAEALAGRPAEMTRLFDRGRIEVGRRADFLRLRLLGGKLPQLRETWVRGVRVA